MLNCSIAVLPGDRKGRHYISDGVCRTCSGDPCGRQAKQYR